MVNPQKIKGDSYERSIVDYLRESGFTADRTRAGWVDDRGDIHGVTSPEGKPFTFECKNHRGDSLPGWIKELQREINNAGGVVGVVVHKKHGTTLPSEQFATLPLGMLVQLLKEAGYK
jgi:Holliday junction resolvase